MPASPLSIAVIGAGISGLSCVHKLLTLIPSNSIRITVFEWGRGPGGRTARRRVEIDGDSASFDHACPYFRARTTSFRSGSLRRWIDEGSAAHWEHISPGGTSSSSRNSFSSDDGYYVGTPFSNSMARALVSVFEKSEEHEVRFGEYVKSATFSKRSWRITSEKRETGEVSEMVADALILSDKLLIQSNKYSVISQDELLENNGVINLPGPDEFGSRSAIVLLLAFEKPVLSAGHQINNLILKDDCSSGSASTVFEKVIHDSSKPQRGSSKLDLWVAHTTHEFAVQNMDGERIRDESAVSRQLQNDFLQLLQEELRKSGAESPPTLPSVVYASIFGWDHAQPLKQLAETHRFDASRLVGVCGDFFCGEYVDDGDAVDNVNGVEAAALSGEALAQDLAKAILLRESKI
eukprot:TRINITY_DN25686_c2_g1_i1.p1 TRINITY_DN25686_c2_g1~~TRINITY_DN25686_c2_g1_i1.p1  ORF type:complete len:407 (-),score=34.44 TRINITY_DN25686_c2_g1_i1:153-1373(-)